ncbi:MAG: hypothetical protein V8S34_00290 [Lawsonibacter sp.]
MGSIAIVPTIYRVILGQEKFSQRMRIQGELFKLLFLTFYATLFSSKSLAGLDKQDARCS